MITRAELLRVLADAADVPYDKVRAITCRMAMNEATTFDVKLLHEPPNEIAVIWDDRKTVEADGSVE